jgi:formate C-acetyltransferase
MSAFKVQMGEDISRSVKRQAERFRKYALDMPFSFESCLLEGCVEAAMDCNDPRRNPAMGGPGYIHMVMHGGGLATTADSLAAIKKMVYEEGEISLPDLTEILDDNFEGHELLRLKLANKYPKFGNDDDYVDSIAAEIGHTYCAEVLARGSAEPSLGPCWPTLYSYHRYRSCGLETGATPDGRMAFQPVSENQSPVNGCDKKGISALVNSLSKLKSVFELTPGGGLSIHIHPTALMVDSGAKVISDVYETYFGKGGLYIQLNVVDRDTLLNAQEHPEQHRELLVRVTGYSAYFVTLSPETQDNIIARYAHSA